ncbi:hypothetical protein Z042_06705 [Chania multitudinisentens RB-25]|uniref:HTH luxR-type domain-containing protein n=1 Tax=Chania multitudinisentens RB-25 TaxID=1441930 RepID=W0LL10_9GAMM|nr:hypothetical protein Z042_06705 [Chania multitudinisentens RB-25]
MDIVILTLSNSDYNLAALLRFIGEYLPQTSPSCKVVLLSEVAYVDVLKNYFSGLQNVWLTLDSSISLEELQKRLLETVPSHQEQCEDTGRFSAMLTSREWVVLQNLLAGKTPSQIANDLQLNYKTISHHKRAALTKLGMRSLCPLLVRNHALNNWKNVT